MRLSSLPSSGRCAWPLSLVLSVLTCGLAIAGAGQDQGTADSAAKTVWDGVFTSEQAERGWGFYNESCAACHGAALEGGEYRALTGDRFWTSWQGTTVDRLLTQISTTMPHSEDGSLKGTLGTAVYADIVSHILSSNGFPSGPRELTAVSAAGVQIVPKDGSGELPSGSFVQVVGCLTRGDTPKSWKVRRASSPARVLAGDSGGTAAPPGSREFALLFVLTPLDELIGHRVAVRGSLVGIGGADGVNVTTVTSVSAMCE